MLSNAYEHITNTMDYEIIDMDMGIIKVEFLGIEVIIDDNGDKMFQPIPLKHQFDIAAQTETDNSKQWFDGKWGRYFETHPESFKVIDGQIWASMKLFDRMVITMLSKFLCAVESWLDGEEDWKRHFEEFIYVRCDPKFEQDDRIVKVGRAMNLYGRNAGYQQHGKEGNPDTIYALFHVKYGSPAEKRIKAIFRKHCGKKPKKSKSGEKLKAEHFYVSDATTDKEYVDTLYDLAQTFSDEWNKANELIDFWWLRDYEADEVKDSYNAFVLKCMPWARVSKK